MVVGYWGDVSMDLDRIIRAVAEARVLHLARETGRPITDAWDGPGAAFVRAQAACLVSRMGHLEVEPGRRQPGGRWQWEVDWAVKTTKFYFFMFVTILD